MEQPVPASKIDIEGTTTNSSSPKSVVLEDTTNKSCPVNEPPAPKKEEPKSEVIPDCPPVPICRDPAEAEPVVEKEPEKEPEVEPEKVPEPAAGECPPCPPCPPTNGDHLEPVADGDENKLEAIDEEPKKCSTRPPCPEPLYPPCKSALAPCEDIVCPQDG